MRSRSWRAWAGAAVVCALAPVRPVRADGHLGSWTKYNGGSFGSVTFNDVQSIEYDHRVPMIAECIAELTGQAATRGPSQQPPLFPPGVCRGVVRAVYVSSYAVELCHTQCVIADNLPLQVQLWFWMQRTGKFIGTGPACACCWVACEITQRMWHQAAISVMGAACNGDGARHHV